MFLENKEYISNEFWNGGQAIQVNDGVIELTTDCEISQCYAILLSHGFHVVENNALKELMPEPQTIQEEIQHQEQIIPDAVSEDHGE